MERRPRITHVPALDGLRGAAVVAVLLFHAGHLSGGFLGVDLFFTLSGFLITSLLVAEWRADDGISLGAFWARRFRRLMPAAVVVIVLTAIFWGIWGDPTELTRLRGDAIAALFYVANWHAIASGRGYWDSFSAPSPFEHMWSLAIEEQFYLLWPAVVLALLRAGRGRLHLLVGFAAAAAVGSSVLMVVMHHPGDDPSRVYLGSDTRAASILIGALVALLIATRGPAPETGSGRTLATLAGAAAVVALGWSWVAIDGLRSSRLFEGGLTLHAIGAGVVIYAVVSPGSGLLGRALAFPPLRWAGLISYGLYLWHWPVFVWLSPSRTGLDGWSLVGVRLAVSVALAVVSYVVLEQPIRHGALRGRFSFTLIPSALAAGTLAVLVATAAAVPAPENILAAPERSTPPTDPPPATTAAPGDRKLMVVGDSVAMTIGAGLDAEAADLGITVLNRGFLGCGLARGDGKVRIRNDQVVDEHPDCHAWPERWAKDLAEFRPEGVLLTIGAWDLADRTRNGEWTHPCADGFDLWYQGEVAAALGVLGSTGVPVTVTTVPDLRSDVLGITRDEGDARVACLNADITTAARTAGATIVDLATWVCPAGSCVTTVDGVTLRDDGVHYNGEGGKVVARWLAPQIRYSANVSTSGSDHAGAGSSAPPPTGASVPTTTVAPVHLSDLVPHPVPADPVAVLAMAGRTPTRADPLRVLTVGDSLMWDAQLGIGAALEATGVVKVQFAGIQGFGLARPYPWRTEWPRLLAESGAEVVVAMWGGWDIKVEAFAGSQAYESLLDEAVRTITATGAKLVVIGLAPSMEGWISPTPTPRSAINQQFEALPARFPGQVVYVDPDPIVAPTGVATKFIDTPLGPVRVRKRDLDHFCPPGAARFGQAVLDLLGPAFALPPAKPTWTSGSWTSDERYDTPATACSL